MKLAKELPAKWSDAERGRATSYAAKALLAKVYLYQKKFNEAKGELEPVVAAIQAGNDLALVPTPNTFPNDLKTSKDIIFAVQYLKGGIGESVHQNNRYRNNDNGNVIVLPQSEFENNDNRKKLLESPNSGKRPGKFDAPATNNETSADFPVMRCAEVMLMYAEVLRRETATSSRR
ncbi:MAG: RagB/SusD family nutrient uptake outer membrane protein [Phocaeicola sp.]